MAEFKKDAEGNTLNKDGTIRKTKAESNLSPAELLQRRSINYSKFAIEEGFSLETCIRSITSEYPMAKEFLAKESLSKNSKVVADKLGADLMALLANMSKDELEKYFKK